MNTAPFASRRSPRRFPNLWSRSVAGQSAVPMITRPTGYWLHAAMAMVATGGMTIAATSAGAQVLSSGGDVMSLDPDNLQAMAESGEFRQLLETLREVTPAVDSQTSDLVANLERYETNAETRDAARQQSLEEALAEMADAIERENLEEALVSAIDAHSQDGTDAFLERPEITTVAQLARDTAAEAEREGGWIEAVTLYRLLDLLFERDSRFSEELSQAVEHVRVLQMYAPDAYQVRSDARIAELEAQRKPVEPQEGEDGEEGETEETPEPPRLDPEPWQDKLRGIDRSVLERAIQDCEDHHIGSPDPASMLAGGVEQLIVLLSTDEASESFPAIANDEARQQFIDRLEGVYDELIAGAGEMSLRQVMTRISLIDTTNRMTVHLPDEVLFYELTEGSTDVVDDFTYVIWPVDTEEFLDRTLRGKIYGVGIQIARDNGELTVITPIANTPAQRAGMRANDVIATVNGVDTSTWSLTRAVREITGEEGTDVHLGIRRLGEDELIPVTLTRAEIPIESIRGWEHDDADNWDFWLDQDAGIGYIRLTQFVEQTVLDMDKAIEQLQSEGELNGLILDLRFNPGGLMESAVDVVDRFVEGGSIVGQVDASGARLPGSLREARSDNTYRDFPLVVLVNQGSASASEIVSGALQDLGRAVVVGENSFGKGSVQQVGWYPNRFRPQWGVRITTSHYTLPSGRVIHREEDSQTWGVVPDLVIDMTERQIADMMEFRRDADVLREKPEPTPEADALLEEGIDPQLEAALLILKADLLSNRLELAAGNDRLENATP